MRSSCTQTEDMDMKPSKRNLLNEKLKAEKLAAGKPVASRYERKMLTPEELHARSLQVAKQARGVVRH